MAPRSSSALYHIMQKLVQENVHLQNLNFKMADKYETLE